jgi:predicted HicB family RNase H-like nuclease
MKALTVRISDELHKALKLKCVSEDVDMNTVITKLIESYVRESKAKSKK